MATNKGFIPIDSDIDRLTRTKTLTGRMTKLRYKLLNRWVRNHSKVYPHCGHEWDCCGCAHSSFSTLEITHNSATITNTIRFNY